jgi:catechol 2,3-dioxygenase-like lactoylglutathione lyase family enzyme
VPFDAAENANARAEASVTPSGSRPEGPNYPAAFKSAVAALAGATTRLIPSLRVPDIAATLDWYTSIGFTEVGRNEDEGDVNWGMLAFGPAQFMLNIIGTDRLQTVALWIYTDKVDELYRLFKARQLSEPDAGIVFLEELYDPFYGGRQFSLRDLNGSELVFYQEAG